MGDTEEVWLTIQEAMTLAKVSRRTIYHWLAKGKLDTRRTPGGYMRIAQSCLLTIRPPLVAH